MKRRYNVICADPAWSFDDKLPGKKRGAAKNYRVMGVDAICGMARGKYEDVDATGPGGWQITRSKLVETTALAMCGKRFRLADDALLFLWRVSSQVEEAYRVVRAWGFAAKSEIVWVKTSGGKPSGGAPYNGRPGFAAGVDTSEEAADAIASEAERLRATVLELIVRRGEKGRTADEIVSKMGVRHHTGAPRVTELHQMGLIVDSGKRRPTRSGKAAIVWIQAPEGTPARPPKGKGFKLHFGMGRYVRNCHETCIIAARGKATSLIASHSVRSVFIAPVPRDERGKIIHSAKPPEFYALVEELTGSHESKRKLELFAREPRAGWRCVGDEIGVVG